MARDFRANQIRTTQIIASGGIGPTAAGKSSIGLLIYSSSDASNLYGGMTHNMTASVGTDVWMFVSGANEGKTKKSGVVCFGGDIVVSGVFYAEKMVVEVTEATTGSLYVSGNLFVSGNGNIRGGLVVNDEGLTVGDFRVESNGEDEALFLDSSANTLYINKGETAFETVIGNTSDEALRIDGEGVVINEDSHADIDFRVESGNVASAIAVNAGTDKVTIDGGAASADALTLKSGHASGGIDIDAGTGGVAIDSTGTVSIDGADDMNFTITSSTGGEDLTIQQVGANDSSIIITAAGTGTDAVKIDATAGDMLVGPTLADGKTLKLGKSGAVEVTIAPHGTASSEKYTVTNTAGTAVDAISLNASAGGILINADASKIHLDAEGTGTNAIDIDSAGGIDIDADGLVAIGGGGGGQFIVGGAGNDLTLSSEGGSLYITGSDNVGIQGEAATATAIVINTSNAAGGIDINAGTGGIAIDANGAISIDAVGPSNITTKGILTVSGSSGLNLKSDGGTIDIETRVGSIDIDSAGTLTIDSAQAIAIGANADKPIDIDSSTLDIDASGAITIDTTSTFSIDGVGTSNITTHGNLALSGSDLVSIESDGGEIDITARQGNIDINATAGVFDVDAAGGITLDGNSASNFSVAGAGNDLTLTSEGGSLYLTGSDNVGIQGEAASSTAVVINASNAAGGIDIDAGTGGVAIDTSGGFSVNGLAASDITVVSGEADENLTIKVDGATASSLILQSAGTGADAIDINASAGGIDIDASTDGIAIDTTGPVSIDGVGASNITTKGILTVSGSTKSLITSTAATALAVQLDASHAAGGVDIRAGTSGVNIATNASGVPVTIGHTTSETRVNDNITILGNSEVRGFVSASLGFSGSLTRLHDGKSFIEAGSGVTVSSASNGAITISSTAGGIAGSGAANRIAYWSASDTLTSNANLAFDGTDATLAGTSKLEFRDSGLFINSRADGHLDIVSDTRLTLTGSGAVADAIALQNSNAAGGMDIDAGNKGITIDTTGIVSIDAVGASNLTTKGILTVSGSTGLNLKSDSGTIDIETRQGAIDVDSAGALTIDSAASISLGTNSSSVAVGIGHTTSETTVNDNLTVAGDATISEYLYHGGDTDTFLRFKSDQVRLAAGGNTNLKMSTDAFLILSGGAATSYNEAAGGDIAFYVSGAIGTWGTATRGTSLFGGDLIVSGALSINRGQAGAGSVVTVTSDGKLGIGSDSPSHKLSVGGNADFGEYIYHKNDTDTFIRFQIDDINIQAGGVDFIKITEDGVQDKITFNDGGADVDFVVESSGEDEAIFLNAGSNELYINKGETAFTTIIGSTNDEAIRVGSAGIIFNEDGHAANDLRVETDSKTHGLFIDSGNNAVLLGSDTLPGTDVFAFISGSTGDHSSGTANRGTTLIGGDLVTSGAMYGKQLEYTYHCYNRNNADAIFIGWYNNNESTGNIDDIQGVMPFGGRPVRVIVRPQNDMGLTAVGFHKSTAGSMYVGTTPIESINNFSAADATPVAFDFTVTGSAAPTARHNAGDVVAISINPSNTPGDCNVTVIWELMTHRIISGSAI